MTSQTLLPVKDWEVLGPTVATKMLLIVDPQMNHRAQVRFDPMRAPECRKWASLFARAEPRTAILKHLLAMLEADESRWTAEVQMIRDELHRTDDDL